MNKVTYRNVSLSAPRLSRDPKNEEQVFLEELRLQHKENKKVQPIIYRTGQAPAWVGDEDDQDVDLLARKKKERLPHFSQIERKVGRTSLPLLTERERESRPRREIYEAQIIRGTKIEEEEEETKEGKEEEEEEEDKSVKDEDEAYENFKGMKIDVSRLEVQGENDEEEVEDVLSARRARARTKFVKKMEEEKVVEEKEIEEKKEEDEGKGDESSDYETDESEEESEDEYTSSRPLLKPVYISKKDRETVAERKKKEEEEKDAAVALKERKEQRKKESKRLVVEEVEKEDELKRHGMVDPEEEEMPDDEDDVDDKHELDRWKIRELRRLKAQRVDDDKHDAELGEVERRRLMTDEQIEDENELDPRVRKKERKNEIFTKILSPGWFFSG